MRFFDNLRLAHKILLIAAIAMLGAALPSVLLLHGTYQGHALLQGSRGGLDAASKVLETMRLVQQHRALSAAVLARKDDMVPAQQAKRAEADAAFARLVDSMQRYDAKLATAAGALRDEWKALADAVGARSLEGRDSFARHTQVISGALDQLEQLLDVSNIAFDPMPDTYYLGQANFLALPHLTEVMGQARGRGVAVLSRGGKPNEAEVAEFTALLRVIQVHARSTALDLTKAQTHNPALAGALGAPTRDAQAAVTRLIGVVERTLLSSAGPAMTPAEYFQETTRDIDAVAALGKAGFQTMEAQYAAQAAQLQRNFAVYGTLVVAVLALLSALTWRMARGTSRSIGQAVDVARRVAQGDLGADIRATTQDEAGDMLRALRDMNSQLRTLVDQVMRGSQSVATASAQIAQGNEDLSQRTEQQASALQQTAASMEQLGQTVQRNADSARQANQLAQSATQIATEGGTVVSEVVQTMKGINESSRRIAEIIGTIDGIAFQTNILALNAAVEAARAGEQGRGFAVVAGEVRSLAQRSAEAARQIKGLITTSVERVEQGTALVDRAGGTMDEIVHAIRRVNDIVGEISTASEEQSRGVAQVGQAVSQMDQATQQNAALVEQSAAAAESLRVQASQLVAAVSSFKLGDAAADAAQAAPAPAARAGWDGITERRGPDRAHNVQRPAFGRQRGNAPAPADKPADEPARTGSDDWTTF